MLKWIRRLGLGLLVVLVAGAIGLGYVWRVYLDSGFPSEEVRIPANGETLAGTLWLPEGDAPPARRSRSTSTRATTTP